jgi:cytochrome c biogenesis protein CcmG, thiol:disulfide interchange protein DsbE
MISRRAILTLACLAVAGLIAMGVAELPGGSSTDTTKTTRLTRAQVGALLAGSPAPLASLHAQGGKLLGGGGKTLHARLAALKAYPVVINKWASWCVPCKEEFPAFQQASAEYGKRVAFIGLDSGDSGKTNAEAFLRSFPVSYPSWYDPSGSLGEQITDSSFTPVTVFIPVHGKPYYRQGQYPNVGKLRADIERYALNA